MPRHGTSQSVPAGSMRGVLDLLKESGRSKVFFLLGIFTGSYAASWNQPVCSGWFHAWRVGLIKRKRQKQGLFLAWNIYGLLCRVMEPASLFRLVP
jgi:hypothetical protein